jgi:hypothetical protein
MILTAIEKTSREQTRNIGMYLTPPLIEPFSIMDTIIDAPIAVMPMAT